MTLAAVRFALLICGASAALSAAEPYVWIEAEAPSHANITVAPSSRGHGEFLSGGAWISYTVNGDDAAAIAAIPAGGAVLAYDWTFAV